jgi:hypothetical protein
MNWGGSQNHYLFLKKGGGIKLTFAKESKEAAGTRRFDWKGNSDFIGLGAVEIGELLAWDRFHNKHPFRTNVEYVDPSGNKVKKHFSITRDSAISGTHTYTFSLNVATDKAIAEFSLPVSEGEFQVMVTVLQQTLPHLLALHSKPYIAREESHSSSTLSSSGSPISE